MVRRDLTKGSIFKNMVVFSVPLLIGNIFQALYNTVDSIWVGNFIGTEALGAVSVSFPIIFMLISLVLGITMATTVLVSQYAGAKNQEMIEKTINNSFLIISISAIIVSIVGLIFSEKLLILMKTDQDIIGHAKSYLDTILYGLIFMFGYNVISSILRGLGDSITPLIFLIITSIINIILDPFLILGIWIFPRMGVQGAALATVISQLISFILALIYLNHKGHFLSIKLSKLKFNKELTIKTIVIGLPSGLQQIMVSLGLVVLTAIINSFGKDTTAAFGAASRLDQFAHMPAMSFGLAVSTLTGQNIGAGKMDRVKDVYKWGSIITASITGMITLFVLFFPTLILRLFTDDAHVLEIGSEYLRIVGLSYVPFALMFVTNGILRGAGHTFPTMIFSIFSLWILRVPLASYLSSIDSLGQKGIWIAIAISSVMTLLLSQAYYWSGLWKKVKIIDHTKKLKPVKD